MRMVELVPRGTLLVNSAHLAVLALADFKCVTVSLPLTPAYLMIDLKH